MKNKILNFFAIIGMALIILKIVGFFQHEATTRKYWANCRNVKVGMTLGQAREIIGDKEYQHWTKSYKSGSIVVNPQYDESRRFYLEYEMIFAGSDTPKIYFDPTTLLVTEVFLGE